MFRDPSVSSSSTRSFCRTALGVLLLGSVLLGAASPSSDVAIVNAGFEDYSLNHGEWTATCDLYPNDPMPIEEPDPIPGWVEPNPSSTGTFHPYSAAFSGGAAEGQNVAYSGSPGCAGMNSPLSQTLSGELLSVGTTYVLRVDIGNRNDLPFGGFRVQLRSAGNLLGEDPGSFTPPENGFQTSTVVYTIQSNDPVGQPLEIWLLAEGNQTIFDNVRLERVAGSAFCAGDGTGAACPCGSTGAAGPGCPNTNPNGNGARLVGHGSAEFANDSFGFTIDHGAYSKPGILIQGGAALNYPNGNPDVPNASGLFCVNPTLRGHVFFTDGSGVASVMDFQGQPFGVTAQPLGSTTYYQYWFRDPGNPCQNAPATGGSGFNFSNAWRVDWTL